MSKKKVALEDLALFHDAILGVKRLRKDKILLKSKEMNVFHRKMDYRHKDSVELNDEASVKHIQSETYLVHSQPGISYKILRKLRKGQYNVEAILDLHGKNTTEAKRATETFIHQCVQNQVRVGLIIHGKGARVDTPILKNKLNQWLRTTELVLAFCSAQPNHGGQGAVYVLLKSTHRTR